MTASMPGPKTAALMLALSLFTPAAAPADSPRIGLVLGGGGARGTAHIGVLEVLEKLRVPVDCVAGTSMGSLVAGAFASGRSPQQMLDRLAQVDWSDLFEDNPSHAETNYRERRLAQTYYPALELGVTGDGLQMAHGVVGGQKIKLFFNTLIGAERGERNIEKLPLPLSIVTTDIGTGERVVFREGDLSTAMRASMSVPALLAPVHYRERHLVDGGLVDNLPIEEVKKRCQADVIIAVDVGSPLAKPQEVNSIPAVAWQMIAILTEQNANASRALIRPTDVYIKPDLDGISASDFDKFREGAERGRKAAEAQAEKLRRYALPEAQYAAWAGRLRRKAEQTALPRIDEVQIAPMRHVNPETVQKHVEQKTGEPLDTGKLERDVARIYGEGDFESVDYSLLSSRERNILRITPTEKSWGPDYLRFGIDLEASAKQNDFALRAAYHKKWINRLGGEWLSGIQLGEQAAIFTELYQPLDQRQRFFVEPALAARRDRLNIYQDGNRIAEYEIRESKAALNLGANIGTLGQFRFGPTYRKQEAAVETGLALLPSGKADTQGWNAIVDFDQFDRAFFPTQGWAARTEYFEAEDKHYGRLSAHLRAARSWGPYVLNGRFSYTGATHGQLPFPDAGALGGFLNLSGFARNQIIAGDTRFFGLRAEKVIGKMPLGIAGDIRVGLSLEAAQARERFTETHLEGWQKAAAVYLGGDTPLGPAFLAFGSVQGGPSSLYLFIGLPR